MKEDNIKELIRKYEAGKSTLEEEQLLFATTYASVPKHKALVAFVKAHKKTAPKDFNETLWTSFEKKKAKNQRFRIGLLSAAASVLLLITIAVNSFKPTELSYAEKQALLQEVLSMFPKTEQMQSTQNIIYQDDLVIVYTKPE